MRYEKIRTFIACWPLAKLKIAFLYWADTVYAGIAEMSLQAKSKFPIEDMREGITFAHNLGEKVYLTLNLFSHNLKISQTLKIYSNFNIGGVVYVLRKKWRFF